MSKEIVEYPAAYFFGLGIRQERERIINLVELLDISFSAEEGHNFIVGDALDLIDLIKGEQK